MRDWSHFTSDKRRARAPVVERSLMRCRSGMQDDLRGDLAAAVGGDAASAHWTDRDWAVVTFTAKEFAAEQVRRMA